MNEYQSYTSDNRKSKQTINTMEEMSKNQSFRILKLQTSGLGKASNSSKRNPQNFDISQVSTSMPLSQKNMLSFLAFEESKRPNSYEQLFYDLQQSKQQVNNLKDENVRLRTKVQHNEREFLKYENMIEDLTTQKKSNNQESQIIALRKQLQARNQELEEKNKEIDILKKNSKVCKLQELEVFYYQYQIEKKVYFEQTLKMKHMLQLAQDQISYQVTRLDQVSQLESELDMCHEQMFKLQTQNTECNEQMTAKDVIIKQLRSQLKNTQQKMQNLNEKQTQLQLKYDNLQSLYSSLKGNNNTSGISTKFPKEIITIRLHQRRVTMAQFNTAISTLKQTKNKQEFSLLLQQDPFLLNEQESQLVVDKLNGNLCQQFQQLLNYHSLEGLDEQIAQSQINKVSQQVVCSHYDPKEKELSNIGYIIKIRKYVGMM